MSEAPKNKAGVVAAVHGEEDTTVRVVKAVRNVPGVVAGIANYRALIAGTRFAPGEGNMSGAFLPLRPQMSYSQLRAKEVVARYRQASCTVVAELHNSPIEKHDIAWICSNPDTGFHTDMQAMAAARFLLSGPEFAGNPNIVIAKRRFNLMGVLSNCFVLDLGTESPFRDPDYCVQEFKTLVNDFDMDEMVFPLKTTVWVHEGFVPHAERDRAGLPDTIPSFSPIGYKAARRLRVHPDAHALTWAPNLAMAGELVVPLECTLATYPDAFDHIVNSQISNILGAAPTDVLSEHQGRQLQLAETRL